MTAFRARHRRGVGILIASVGLVAVTALAACSSTSGASSSSDTAHGDIVVGASGPLSGPAASLAVLYDGMRSYFDDLNKSGGIQGHQVVLKVDDDEFNPSLTPGVMRKLVQSDKILMACGTAGSDTASAVKAYLNSQGVPSVPSVGSSALLGPTSFLQLPTYTPLAAQMAAFGVQTLGQKRVAIAYSDDAVGTPTRSGADQELTRLGVQPVADVQFNPTATDQSAVAAKLKSSGATYVIMNDTAPVLARIINASAQIGYNPTWGILWPAMNSGLVSLTHGALTDNLYVSSPFVQSSAADAGTYRSAMTTFAPKADATDTIAMLGWSTADTCTQALKAAVMLAKGSVPTSAQILQAMNGLRYSDPYVRGLDWTNGNHAGQNQAQILHLTGGQFQPGGGFHALPDVTESK